MKKRNIVAICLFLIIMLFTTKVNAESEACKVSLSADKTTLEPGDIVTINILISNVTKTDGVALFCGELDFSSDIFELIFDEEDETILEDYEDFEGYSILYSGRNNDEETNPWYVICAEESNIKAIIVSMDTAYSEEVTAIGAGESQVVGKIKLKVKDSAEGTTEKISLTNMEVYGENNINDTTTETPVGEEISDSTINLTIKGTEISTIQENKSKENTELENNSKENLANNNVPYTGIEDTIPVIFILVIIALFTYINYKKYKNI